MTACLHMTYKLQTPWMFQWMEVNVRQGSVVCQIKKHNLLWCNPDSLLKEGREVGQSSKRAKCRSTNDSCVELFPD